MKQCPKCQANIIDTAKFCPKCGVNIKQYEEENPKDSFCSECGAKLVEGDFCPECGARVNNTEALMESTDTFGDDWLSSINEVTAADVEREEARKRAEAEAKREAEEREKQRKAAEEVARQDALRQEQLRQAELRKRRNTLFDQKFQKEGNTIVFGRYPQHYAKGISAPGADGYCSIGGKEYYRINKTREVQKTFRTITENVVNYIEIEPIHWFIIQETDDSVFVVADKILDYRIFREDKNANRANDYINSDIRKWLNTEFLNRAFTGEEQLYIQPIVIDYQTDKLFLLSDDEYWMATRNGYCSPSATSLVISQQRYSYSSPDWWLRTPDSGSSLVETVGNCKCSSANYREGVVPALRIDKTKLC